MLRLMLAATMVFGASALHAGNSMAAVHHLGIEPAEVAANSRDGCTVKRRTRSRLLDVGRVSQRRGEFYTRDAFRTLALPPLTPKRKGARGVACAG